MKRTAIKRHPPKEPIERIPLALKRPGEVKTEKPAVKVFPSGREVCNHLTKAGRDEYQKRKRSMWERQSRKCGLQISRQCKERNGRWPLTEIQFGHDVSRGGGKQDDRIEVDGKPKNHALCPFCNSLQGSRPITDFLDVI